MTPEELLEAAEKVKKIVEAMDDEDGKNPYSIPNIMEILKQLPNITSPPIHEEPRVEGWRQRGVPTCPNYPNPCYCTGACRMLGDFKKPPGTLTVYC